MHPLLNLLAMQSQLLGEHAEASADLLSAQFGATTTGWARPACWPAWR